MLFFLFYIIIILTGIVNYNGYISLEIEERKGIIEKEEKNVSSFRKRNNDLFKKISCLKLNLRLLE